MTVPTTTAFTGPYYPNGVTVEYPFAFKVNGTDEVSVFYIEDDGSETIVPSADYSVVLSSNENNPGGTVTTAAPLPDSGGKPLYIALDPDFTQSTKFEDEGAFNQSILNPTFDAGALRSIWLRARLLRAPILPLDPASVIGKFPFVMPSGLFGWTTGVGADANFRFDLAQEDGADWIGFRLPVVGALLRALRAKVAERASVKDFGAVGDGVADDTAAIQAAINSGIKNIHFPPGTYRHAALNFNQTYQHFHGAGAILVRTSALVTITISARGVVFWGVEFSGGGLAGNNLTITAPEATFHGCTSRNTFGRCLYALDDGGNTAVFGGIWNTLDLTGNGYEFEFKDTVVATSLYAKIVGISTQQTFGGILLDGQSTIFVSDSQFGKLTVLRGTGSYVNNRIIGTVSVQYDSNHFENNKFAGDISFGDGAGPAIGNCMFGPTNTQAALKSFTIGSEVIESAFHLNQLANVTLIINGLNNDIWHNRIAYNSAIVASGGAPALGNGTLAAGYSRAGRDITVDLEFAGGSTTNYGTGVFYFNAPSKAGGQSFGSGVVTESGVRSYTATPQMSGADNRIAVFMADTSGAQPAGATYPFAWSPGAHVIRIQITYKFYP